MGVRSWGLQPQAKFFDASGIGKEAFDGADKYSVQRCRRNWQEGIPDDACLVARGKGQNACNRSMPAAAQPPYTGPLTMPEASHRLAWHRR